VTWPITRPLRACRAEITAEVSSHGVLSPGRVACTAGQSQKQRAKPGGDQDEYEDPPIRLKRNYASTLAYSRGTVVNISRNPSERSPCATKKQQRRPVKRGASFP